MKFVRHVHFRDATFPDLSGIPDFPGSEGPVRVNHPDLVLFFLVVMGGGLNSVANRYPGRNVGRGNILFKFHRPRSLSIFLI